MGRYYQYTQIVNHKMVMLRERNLDKRERMVYNSTCIIP